MAIFNMKVGGAGANDTGWDNARLHIYAPAGSTVTVSNGTISETPEEHPIEGYDSEYIYNVASEDFGTWTVTTVYSGHTSTITESVTSNTEYFFNASNFTFTYSGNMKVNGLAIKPNIKYSISNNFELQFLTSGTLNVISSNPSITYDISLVGGGSGGTGSETNYSGNGGNGGRITNQTNFSISDGQTYSITVGSGSSGVGRTSSSKGGDSIAFGYTGSGGPARSGGNGAGSGVSGYGGGGWGCYFYYYQWDGSWHTSGGANGANGTYPYSDSTYGYKSGGGAGGSNGHSSVDGGVAYPNPGQGGGGSRGSGSGTTNSGGGGGGANGTGTASGGTGGSGIVILRTHR